MAAIEFIIVGIILLAVVTVIGVTEDNESPAEKELNNLLAMDSLYDLWKQDDYYGC